MEDQHTKLTKKERKALAKEKKRLERESKAKKRKFGKLIIFLGIILVLSFAGWKLISETSSPLPGEQLDDLGADHISDISEVAYNSNPPTSGPHFPIWTKRGVYDREISDGYLIHSLEHGYIVISYNCEITESSNLRFFVAFAHDHEEELENIDEEATESAESKPLTRMNVALEGNMSWFTAENPPFEETELPESFSSNECHSLVDNLSDIADDYERVIVVPRTNLDTRIALTAWTRINKMNNLDDQRIRNFIKAYHNRGPEKTDE